MKQTSIQPDPSPQNAELFHLIVENVQDYAIFMMDADGVIISWNPGVEKLLGYAESEITGKPSAVIFTPEDAAAGIPEREMETAARAGRAEDKRWHRRRDGSRFRANGLIMPLKNKDGSLRGYVKIVRDDTAQKSAEEKAGHSSELFENVLESIGDGFYALDAEWRFVYINKNSELLTKRTREELLGRIFWEEFPETAGSTFEENYRRAMRENIPVSFEEFYPPLDIWFEVRAYPSTAGLSIYFHNITERKRAELNAQLLFEVNETLARISGAGEIMREAGRIIGTFFKVSHCAFVELDVSADTAAIKYDWRQSEETASIAGLYPLKEYVSEDFRASLAAGQPVIINDVAADPRTANQTEKFRKLGLGSFINTPYVSGGELKFVLGIYRKDACLWREDEIDLLRELTARIWLTIERQQAEINLRETEECYRALIEATATTVWHAAPDGNLSFVGEGWTEVSGQPVEEILQTGWFDAVHPDDREPALKIWRDALQNKTLYAAEFRILTKTGKYKWFAANAVPIFDWAGNVREWVGINIDIDAARQAEILSRNSAALAEESRQRLQTALKAGKMGSWEFDLTTGEMTASDVCKINYGRLPEETFTFTELNDSIFEADLERWLETVDEAVRKCADFEIEYRVYWRDQSIHWVLVRGNCFADDAGETVSLAGVSMDITERREAEEKIRESEEKFSALAESVPQLVWMADADGFIFWYNRNWYDYTGLTPADLAGWGWQRAHDPEMLEQVTARWANSIETGEPFEMEFPLRGADGSFRWFLTRINPLRNEEGRIFRWFGTSTDIEELRQIRMRAEQSNQLKDEFLSTLSHELRTPLNAILGWTQMLMSRPLDEKERKNALSTIERSARAQNLLIDDLLDVSRIITGKLRLDVRAVDLPDIIKAAVDAARPAAEAKNIRLQTLLDPQAEPVSGDPDRLHQVIWNLLNNAVKFTPEDGRVQVRLGRVDSHVEIVVSDTGAGIEPEFLPYVFDRFRQSDGSMTRRHGGLGLGLAIVRQLVEMHGGSVSVSSAGSEQGTTFTIDLPILPVRRDEPESAEPQVPPTAGSHRQIVPEDRSPELTGLRVLLVDDEADSRDLLSLVLSLRGALVTTANSAREALAAIKSESFNIVISDIGMPDEDGFSLIGKIRKLPAEEGGNIPAIALTAYARPEDRVKALRSGFQMHVAKPVEPDELIAAVANVSGRTKIR